MRTFAAFIPVFLSCFLASCSNRPVYPAPTVVGKEVVIDAGKLRPESPVFFSLPYRGKNINFFVLRTRGRVLSFLDACASCYPSKRGYRVEGGYIVCRKCELRYAISDMEKGFGGCFPIRAEGRLLDGRYRIPVSLLERAADKF